MDTKLRPHPNWEFFNINAAAGDAGVNPDEYQRVAALLGFEPSLAVDGLVFYCLPIHARIVAHFRAKERENQPAKTPVTLQ